MSEATTAKYSIDTLEVKESPEGVLDAYLQHLRQDDFLGDYTRCLSFLPHSALRPYMREDANVPKRTETGPYEIISPPARRPDTLELKWVPPSEWVPATTEDLRNDVRHYRDWWRQKVEDGRGISVGRGKAFLVCYLLVAGCPEWRKLHEMDGGWYQEDAYNFVADLFGWPHATG